MDFKPVASYFRLAGHIWIVPVFLFSPVLFGFVFLFFPSFSFPFCKPDKRCSVKFRRHLPQAVEQRAEPHVPCSDIPTRTQGGQYWEGRAGRAEPGDNLPFPPLPPFQGSMEIKIPPCLSSTPFCFSEKHIHKA